MVKTYRNVCEAIVASNLCIGCGICAGICPARRLAMRFNQYGEYIPVESQQACLPTCECCLRGCPFWSPNDHEEILAALAFREEARLSHRPETGYYGEVWAGYALQEEHRLNAASGGLATWFLQTILEQGLVDRVITVAAHDHPGKLFCFTVWDDPKDVPQSAKSCYYPVEMSAVITEILQTKARYAVIGLPCFLKGLRLAIRLNERLKERITVLCGLVCGHTKSTFFAEYLCALRGGNPSDLTTARFRIKDLQRPANDFGFYFECRAGKTVQSGTVFSREGMDKAWVRQYFKPNACNYCDDVFAEVADIVFMDAWLDRYIQDPRGTNFVVSRRAAFRQYFQQGQQDRQIYLEDVSIDDVIKSQQSVIDLKRTVLAERLAMAKMLRWQAIPDKRVAPARISLFRLGQLGLQHWLISASKKAFLAQRGRRQLDDFERRVRPILFLQKLLAYLQYLARRIGVLLHV